VGDASLPDGSIVAPGSLLNKQWALKNTGTAPWPLGTRIVQLTGLSSEVEMQKVPRASPGETVQIGVNVLAPMESQHFVGYFRLQAPQGKKFGPRFWFDFMVRPSISSKKST
jgi:next-to-BRCA1 protein 1